MRNHWSAIMASLVFFGAVPGSGQIVSFNTPSPWLTQRNDSIVVRAQIDTAQVKKKAISISVQLVNDGKKSRITSKSFKITDYSGEFSLGTIKKNLIGGKEFLKFDWSIPGTIEKGTIAPVGIMNLDKMPPFVQIPAACVKENATLADAAASVKEFSVIGKAKAGFGWNKTDLYIVIETSADSGTLQFALDGKNGKNAYISYPDRIIVYAPSKDSVYGIHYNRDMRNDSLIYIPKDWETGITKSKIDGKVVIKAPWYQTGIIPFEDRTIGFGAFALNSTSAQTAAVPSGAKYFIPGTWGDLLLKK